jgi:hypothetical protein
MSYLRVSSDKIDQIDCKKNVYSANIRFVHCIGPDHTQIVFVKCMPALVECVNISFLNS